MDRRLNTMFGTSDPVRVAPFQNNTRHFIGSYDDSTGATFDGAEIFMDASSPQKIWSLVSEPTFVATWCGTDRSGTLNLLFWTGESFPQSHFCHYCIHVFTRNRVTPSRSNNCHSTQTMHHPISKCISKSIVEFGCECRRCSAEYVQCGNYFVIYFTLHKGRVQHLLCVIFF
jgi:hypothetical protein